MHSELLPFWERAEALKADILAKADAVPEPARAATPKPGDWSVLQMVSHMGIAERFVSSYGKKSPGTLPPAANPFVIQMICATLSAGVAVPAPEIMTPEVDGKSLETLGGEWGAARSELLTVLETADPRAMYGVHPYFGAITVRQTIEMLAAHTAYHYKRFPKTAR